MTRERETERSESGVQTRDERERRGWSGAWRLKVKQASDERG